jgi:phosphohistidine phosphatase SixA
MIKWKLSRWQTLTIAWVIGMVLIAFPATAQQPQNNAFAHTHVDPKVIELAKQLRKGGYTIFFRHERTSLERLRDQRPYDLSTCTGQRMLSPAGIETSKEIGHAFKQLNIPVGEVLASPLCRTKDTAKLAFAQITTTEKLMGEDREKQRTREAVGNDLKQLVNQHALAKKALAQPSSNLVLVGHFGSSLAIGRILSEGEALILESDGRGGVRSIGQITSAQWGDVVRDLARMEKKG